MLDTLRPVTFETPTRLVVEAATGLEEIRPGEPVEIYSIVAGDSWHISATRVEQQHSESKSGPGK